MKSALCFATALTLFFTLNGAALHAADGAASRSANVDAVARSAAKARSSSGGAFFGIVPGASLTDPVTINTSITDAMTVDYGDGTTITYQPGETPSHTYTTGGVYKPKIVTGTGQIITINLTFAVPFNSGTANVFGMGVRPDPEDKKGVDILSDFSGSATIDMGDGQAPFGIPQFDPGTNAVENIYDKGFYNAIITSDNGGQQRTGSVSFSIPLVDAKAPEIDISGVTIAPNPAKAGDAITFSGAITAKGVTGDLSGKLDFGDGSAPFQASGSIAGTLKTGVQHTYAADGAYTAVLTITGTGASASTKAFVIIGRETVINSDNSAFATEQDSAGGNVALVLNPGGITGVTDATTSYDDTLPRFAPVAGLIPTRAFVAPTIAVATSTLLDGAATPKGKIRKTIVVGARATGDSSALADPPSNDIKLKKMSGKFLFTKSTADQVSFSGTLQLPAGFDPAKAGGNSVDVGIGNIVDTLLVDAKGKPVDKSTGASQRLKKFSIKYPKLSGPAAGGEVAQMDFTISIPDMDTAGFDTEGITSTLRADERKLKAANRFVQVDLLLSGVAYEAYIPVQYKVSTKGDAGQLQGRAAK